MSNMILILISREYGKTTRITTTTTTTTTTKILTGTKSTRPGALRVDSCIPAKP